MHEGVIMQKVVTTILAAVDNRSASRVTHVQLELGTSEHFTEEAVCQYFQVLTQGTLAEGAELELSWLPATYQCLSCQQRFESTSATGICPHCGEVSLETTHSDGCAIRAIDVVASDE
jgi:hydrogenase nickel incorporation protein HypA/HybF